MTHFNSTQKFTASAVFGAAAIISMLSLGGKAEAASVFSCQGPTVKKVVDCCEQLTRINGRPLWMIQSGTNCHKAAVCRKGKPLTIGIAAVVVKRCYVHALLAENNEGGDGKKGGTRSRSRSAAGIN